MTRHGEERETCVDAFCQKKMKVMEKCLSQSDSKQRDEKKMLIFDIGFFCVLVQTFEGWAV